MIFEMNDLNHHRLEESSSGSSSSQSTAVTTTTSLGEHHHHHHHNQHQHLLDEEELSSSSSLDAFSTMSPMLGYTLPNITTDHHSSAVNQSITTTAPTTTPLNPTTTGDNRYEFVNPAYLSSTFLPTPVVNTNKQQRSREEARIVVANSHRANHHTKSHNHHNQHHNANVNNSKYKAGVLWPSSNTATKPLKCICKNNEKHFKCSACTQNYPISVRRSKDDEASTIAAAAAATAANQLAKQQKRAKERMEFEARFNNNNSMQQVVSNGGMVKSSAHQQQAAALTSQSYSESSSIESNTSSSLSSSSSSSSDSNVYDTAILKLKPSPIPISSTLIALLALTNPGNKFRPPPNVNLAHHVNQQSHHVDKK